MRKLIRSVAAMLAGAALFAALSYAAAPRNLGRAIEVQRALVAERPTDSSAENDLGNLLVLADDMEGAEQAYRRALELDETNASAHFNLGLLLQQQGERKQALKEFERTLELDPRHAWAQYQIGTILHAQGSESAARKAYAKALALDPDLGNPRVNPHLIDNELATAAMLYAYHHYRDELLPAKEYEEPARIAGVLIDRPAGDTQAGEAGVEAASGAAGGFVRGPETAGASGEAVAEGLPTEKVEPPDEDPTAESESRTLSNKDLDPSRASNQIVGGGVPARAGAAGRTTGGQITSGNRGRTRDAQPTPLRPTLRGPTGSGSAPLAPVPPTTFQPTGDSTGMIEVRLVEIDEWS